MKQFTLYLQNHRKFYLETITIQRNALYTNYQTILMHTVEKRIRVDHVNYSLEDLLKIDMHFQLILTHIILLVWEKNIQLGLIGLKISAVSCIEVKHYNKVYIKFTWKMKKIPLFHYSRFKDMVNYVQWSYKTVVYLKRQLKLKSFTHKVTDKYI